MTSDAQRQWNQTPQAYTRPSPLRSRPCADCKALGETRPATRLVPVNNGSGKIVPRCTFHWQNPLTPESVARANPQKEKPMETSALNHPTPQPRICKGLEGEPCTRELAPRNRTGMCTRCYQREWARKLNPDIKRRGLRSNAAPVNPPAAPPKPRKTRSVAKLSATNASATVATFCMTQAQIEKLFHLLPVETQVSAMATAIEQYN